MGNEQKNAVEGCGIHLFIELLKTFLGPEEASKWIVRPCFDGLQADAMIRHASWDEANRWVALQFKASEIQFGKQATYKYKKDQYEPWMYCIAMGIRNYTTVKNPTSVDDIHVPGAVVYEMWDLGTCPNALNPTPATLYRSVEPSKRCFFKHDASAKGYAQADVFVRTLVKNLHAWARKHTFSAEKILFCPELNKKSLQNPNKAPEMLGLFELAKVLPEMRAPFRQNETVDSVWSHLCYSNKTAKISNGDPKQRRVELGAHKFDHFCHWVIASYGGDDKYKKVAVIPAAVVYRNGKSTFCWNEAKPSTMKHVKLFDLETQGEELRAYLEAGPPDVN